MTLNLPASYKTGTATIKGAQSATVTITIASPAVVSWTAHGLSAGDTFVPTTTGALPTGLTAGTTYYVLAAGLTTNAFEVSATPGGAAINTSGSQSGTQTGASTSFTVLGIGTAWSATVQVGDTFVGTDGREVEIASVTDDTHVVLDHAWPGASQAAAYYRIVYAPDGNRQLVKTRQMVEALKIPQTGMPMVFDGTGTTDIYPGQGKVRFNDPTTPTIAYIAKTDIFGNSIDARLLTLDDSVNAVSRSVLSFRPTDGANAFVDFDVTGALTDGTTYYKVPVTMRSGTVPANLATLAMAAVPSGKDGAAGTNGTNGTNGVLSAVESVQTNNYTIVTGDKGKTIIANKASAIAFTLDTAVNLGSAFMVAIKNIGAGTLTLSISGGAAFDDTTTSITVPQYTSLVIECNGTVHRAMLTGGAAGARTVLQAARTYYVGAPIPTPTISIASPAVVSSTAHGLSVNDQVVFNVPANTAAATISAANPAVVTMTNTFAAGQPIVFASTGSLPYGVVPGTTYYVIATGLSGSSFQFSATVGGSAISTASPTAGFTNGSANITITTANTYYAVGQTVRFATSGGLPTNFAINTDYYVVSASSTLITVAATNGGSAIVAGSAGTGTQTAMQAGTHYVSTGGALPTGVTAGTAYYVGTASTNSFTLSTTLSNANPVNTSGSVTGSPIYNAYTGNDANNGLAQTRAGAFLTLQAAINALGSIDRSIYSTVIQLCTGLFTGSASMNGTGPGSGTITVQGVSQWNTVLSTGSSRALLFQSVIATLQDINLVAATAEELFVGYGGNVAIARVNFGATTSPQIHVEQSARFGATDNYTISGGAQFHMYVRYASTGEVSGKTITILGTPAIANQFIDVEGASDIYYGGNTFVGNMTGQRFAAQTNGVLNTNGGGASYLPGNSAGIGTNSGTSPYGLYQ